MSNSQEPLRGNGARRGSAQRLAQNPSPRQAAAGRRRKELAMIRARELAHQGGFNDWLQVLDAYERESHDMSLRLWSASTDRSEIDALCMVLSRR